MAVIIHSHALQRMEERGASRDDVLRAIEMGRLTSAKFGRRRYGLTYPYGDHWRGQEYESKHVEVYCVEEGEDIIVVTVVVKYF